MPEYPNNLSGIQSQLQKERLPVGWPWRFFTVMLVIFLVVLLGYLGLSYGYAPLLQNQLNSLNTQSNSLSNQIQSGSTESNVLAFYSQLVNVEKLLRTHVNPSLLLPLLASSTNPQVNYTSVDVKLSQNEADISGVAASYAVLASQLQAYENSPWITRVILGSSKANGSAVIFQAQLFVKPQVFGYATVSSTSSNTNGTTTTP